MRVPSITTNSVTRIRASFAATSQAMRSAAYRRRTQATRYRDPISVCGQPKRSRTGVYAMVALIPRVAGRRVAGRVTFQELMACP